MAKKNFHGFSAALQPLYGGTLCLQTRPTPLHTRLMMGLSPALVLSYSDVHAEICMSSVLRQF